MYYIQIFLSVFNLPFVLCFYERDKNGFIFTYSCLVICLNKLSFIVCQSKSYVRDSYI